MLGLVCYRDGKEKNGTRTLFSLRVCAVYVERGEGMRARLSAKRAAKYLKKRHVRAAVFPCGYPCASVFAAAGIMPPPELPLRMAKAAEITLCAMKTFGILPEKARVALVSSSINGALDAAAYSLVKTVRYLTLCTPERARLARALRWDSGASVQEAQSVEEIDTDLAVVFDAFAPMCRCPQLRLSDPALLVEWETAGTGGEETLWDARQLLAVRFAAGMLRADEICVKMVKFPAKAGENGNLP